MPSVPAVAMVEPESVEKIVPETRVRTLNLPGMRPIQLSMISITRLAIPEWNMMVPMKMNSGTGAMANMLIELNRLTESTLRPLGPIK